MRESGRLIVGHLLIERAQRGELCGGIPAVWHVGKAVIGAHPHPVSLVNGHSVDIVRGQSVGRCIDLGMLRLQVQVHKSATIRGQPQAFAHRKDEVDVAIAPHSVAFGIVEVPSESVSLHVNRVKTIGSGKGQGVLIRLRDVVNEVYRIATYGSIGRQSDQGTLVTAYP